MGYLIMMMSREIAPSVGRVFSLEKTLKESALTERTPMDQRIGDKLYDQIIKAVDYFIDEFDATEYEVIGALEWAKAVVVARNIGEPDEED